MTISLRSVVPALLLLSPSVALADGWASPLEAAEAAAFYHYNSHECANHERERPSLHFPDGRLRPTVFWQEGQIPEEACRARLMAALAAANDPKPEITKIELGKRDARGTVRYTLFGRNLKKSPNLPFNVLVGPAWVIPATATLSKPDTIEGEISVGEVSGELWLQFQGANGFSSWVKAGVVPLPGEYEPAPPPVEVQGGPKPGATSVANANASPVPTKGRLGTSVGYAFRARTDERFQSGGIYFLVSDDGHRVWRFGDLTGGDPLVPPVAEARRCDRHDCSAGIPLSVDFRSGQHVHGVLAHGIGARSSPKKHTVFQTLPDLAVEVVPFPPPALGGVVPDRGTFGTTFTLAAEYSDNVIHGIDTAYDVLIDGQAHSRATVTGNGLQFSIGHPGIGAGEHRFAIRNRYGTSAEATFTFVQ